FMCGTWELNGEILTPDYNSSATVGSGLVNSSRGVTTFSPVNSNSLILQMVGGSPVTDFNVGSATEGNLGIAAVTYRFTASVAIKQWRLGTTAVTQQVDFDNLDNHAWFTATV